MVTKKRRFLGVILAFALILGLMSGNVMTVLADSWDGNPYAELENNSTTTVSFNDLDWYIIKDESTAENAGSVTLLMKDLMCKSTFGTNNSYSSSTVKEILDGLTASGGSFEDVASAIKSVDLDDVGVQGAKLYLLSASEAQQVDIKIRKKDDRWWLRSKAGSDVAVVNHSDHSSPGEVNTNGVLCSHNFSVRPALQLDLSKVKYDSDSKKFSILPPRSVTLTGGANATVSGGEVKQTGITGEMKTVTYTAKSGYKFPETSDYFKTTNGITVDRTSDTVVTVSGKPTADTEMTVPDAEEVPVHRHDIQLVKEKEPTCTEDGFEEHYECTECGKWFADKNGNYEYSDSEIAELKKKATGHKWDSGVVTKEATYDETGIKTYTCSVCGETKEETIPKKTRSYSNDSDNDSSDGGSSGGGSGGKSGSFSTQSLDVNGNAFGGPSAGHQPDSGMPLSDRGGNWGSMANNWSYTKSDGNLARNEWLNLEYNGHTYWYFLDGNSTMQTDWLNYNGATYYFVPDMDGWRGRMATGWHQIGEKWYYFEPTAGAYQGVMYRGAVTPDGHIVGADGAWNGVGTTPESSAQTGTTASGT